MMRPLFLLLALLLAGCQSSSKELYIYCWAGYISPSIIKEFEEKYDCRIILDSFDSNESMYAKMKAGAADYDLVFPSGYYASILCRQGMILPLDSSKIPHAAYLDETILEAVDDEARGCSIPYAVSLGGVGYRKDKLKEPIERSWSIFSRGDLKGRMTMLNDYREVLGAALTYLGYSVNSTNEAEIEEAADQVLEWKKNLAKFENEQYKNGIADAEYYVVHGWSGDILQVMQQNPQVDFFLPKEGSVSAFDVMAIPSSAKSVDLAYAFINFLLEPENSAKTMEHTYYLLPNRAAYAFLPESLKGHPVLFPDEGLLQRAEAIQDLGEDNKLYLKAWDRIKN